MSEEVTTDTITEERTYYILDHDSDPINGEKTVTFKRTVKNPSCVEIRIEDDDGWKWAEVEADALIAMMQCLKIKRRYMKKSWFTEI